jgi:uncharacterized surface protein with fasciclin (FAS1) repeats
VTTDRKLSHNLDQAKTNQIITMKLFTTSIFAAFTIAFVAIQVQANAGKTVVGIAAGNENISSLEAAVKAAGLVKTLSGDRPFTVSAPTNEAFAKLPEGTVESLLKPENKDKLIFNSYLSLRSGQSHGRRCEGW